MLLRAMLHYNSVCSILTHRALAVLGQAEDAGHLLYDMWFANHAARSVQDHVDVPMGARDYMELRQSAPLIAQVLRSFPVYPQHVQVAIWQMLVRLSERATAIYTLSMDSGRHSAPCRMDPAEDRFYMTGYYYPGLPIIRDLPRYQPEGRLLEQEQACPKYPYLHRARTPGILAVFCLDCCNLVGFNAMHEFESPRSVFELLFTRWSEAPEVVIYDNACNLAIYSHMRESWFFRDSLFVVDRLHEHAHRLCSPTFQWDLVAELYGRNS